MAWDDDNSYTYTINHSIKDWGWEFIRRNPIYQREWRKEFKKFNHTPKNQVLMPFLLAPDVSQYSKMDQYHLSYEPLNLIDPAEVDTFVIPGDGAIKWSLRYYQNPDANKLVSANYLPVKMLHIGDTSGRETHDKISVVHEDHTLIAVIDLKRPIAPQMEELSRHAKEKQTLLKQEDSTPIIVKTKNVSPNDRELWTEYLRCLDARKAKVTRKDAAPIFLIPTNDQSYEERWDEVLKQAKRMLHKGFFQLMS